MVPLPLPRRLPRHTPWILTAALVAVLSTSAHADEEPAADPLVGTWHLITDVGGGTARSRLEITRDGEGALAGTYHTAQGPPTPVTAMTFADGTLRFERRAGPRTVGFEARVEGDRFQGHHRLGTRRFAVWGARTEAARRAMEADVAKAMAPDEDLEKDYDRHARQALPRDAFPVLFDPTLVPAADAKILTDDDPVLGVCLGGEAKAYPIAILGVHELVNDTCGGRPIAASW